MGLIYDQKGWDLSLDRIQHVPVICSVEGMHRGKGDMRPRKFWGKRLQNNIGYAVLKICDVCGEGEGAMLLITTGLNDSSKSGCVYVYRNGGIYNSKNMD